jgi:hypothetical protein
MLIMPITSKSPKLILQAVLEVARRALPLYSHPCSPKIFTQHQLFACLVLKESLRLDYRGVEALLNDVPALQSLLVLKHVPDFSTPAKAHHRLLRSGQAQQLLDATVDLTCQRKLLTRRDRKWDILRFSKWTSDRSKCPDIWASNRPTQVIIFAGT